MRTLALLLTLVVVACASNSPEATVFQIRASYDASVLAPAANYTKLPLCPQPNNVCKDPSVVTALQKADSAARATLDSAEEVVRNHKTLDASAAIDAAQQAVAAAIKIVTTYAIK